MHNQLLRGRNLICALLAATTVSGCSIFLPEHSNSNFREDEDVSIQMIRTCAGLGTAISDVFGKASPSKEDVYEDVFGVKCEDELAEPTRPQGGTESALAAAAAAAAVGLAIDYVHDQLKKEATLYEAQWEQRIAKDDFWNGQVVEIENGKKTSRPVKGMTYVGFQVSRTVGGDAASTAIFAFRASADGRFFLVAPLAYKLDRAKAKVLSDEWFTTYTPWLLLTFPGKFARIAGHSIDTQIAVEMTAFWETGKEERKTEAVAAFVVPIKGYDIAKNLVRYPGDGLPTTPIGWLASVPRSANAQAPKTGGNFTLKVVVTEKDTSNAQQMLVQAADTLQEKAPVIQNYISKRLGAGDSND